MVNIFKCYCCIFTCLGGNKIIRWVTHPFWPGVSMHTVCTKHCSYYNRGHNCCERCNYYYYYHGFVNGFEWVQHTCIPACCSSTSSPPGCCNIIRDEINMECTIVWLTSWTVSVITMDLDLSCNVSYTCILLVVTSLQKWAANSTRREEWVNGSSDGLQLAFTYTYIYSCN